jgi:glycosyltransferase involved in cell wall biosynthesis
MVEGPWGGANSFLRALQHVFRTTHQIKVVDNEWEDYDVLFLNQLYRGPGRSRFTPKFLTVRDVVRVKECGSRSLIRSLFGKYFHTNLRKRQRTHIVCRLVNLREHAYDRKSARNVKLLAVLDHTDFDIFQSKYNYDVFREAGYNKERFTVIHNGVDQDVFNINDKVWWDGKESLRLFSCTFATRQSKRFDLIAKFSEIEGIECYHIGAWPADVNPTKVHLLGMLNQESFIGLYRENAHAFLHPAEKDPCPNAVLEALSCGLPVIYNPHGGTKELVGACGVGLQDGISTAINRLKECYSECVVAIKDSWRKFSIDCAAKQYLSVFKQVMDNDH